MFEIAEEELLILTPDEIRHKDRHRAASTGNGHKAILGRPKIRYNYHGPFFISIILLSKSSRCESATRSAEASTTQ